MSKTLDIFVNTSKNLQEFAQDVASRLNIVLTPHATDDEVWYEYQNERVILTLGEHSFENDRDMLFENYRYHLSIRALNIGTEDERVQSRIQFAIHVFYTLRVSERYSLLLVDDLQTKMREFSLVPFIR